METSGLRFDFFLLIMGVKLPSQKKGFFWGEFCKDQEVIQQGSAGHTTRIRRLYNKDQEVVSRIFFLYRCYYPHRSRDALSPVCGIFKQSIVL